MTKLKQQTEFRFNVASDARLAFGGTEDGTLMVRVTSNGVPSEWASCRDEDMLTAIWAGEGQCIEFWESRHESGNPTVFTIQRGVVFSDGFYDLKDGDKLAFSVVTRGKPERHLVVDRATTGRQLYDQFRQADTAATAAGLTRGETAIIDIENGEMTSLDGGHRTTKKLH